MISQRLKNIFFVSIPILFFHGLEEYFTGFYNTDSHARFVFSYLNTLPTQQAVFLLFQVMLWIALVIFAFLISSEKWRLRLMILPGLIYIYEFHHIWKAFQVGGYYPGIITGSVFPILAFLFWRELAHSLKKESEK